MLAQIRTKFRQSPQTVFEQVVSFLQKHIVLEPLMSLVIDYLRISLIQINQPSFRDTDNDRLWHHPALHFSVAEDQTFQTWDAFCESSLSDHILNIFYWSCTFTDKRYRAAPYNNKDAYRLILVTNSAEMVINYVVFFEPVQHNFVWHWIADRELTFPLLSTTLAIQYEDHPFPFF